MKENLILLVDADGDSEGVVLEAAARTGHKVRRAKTSCDAFQILKDEIRHLDVIIVDVDPGVHGLALLEAISGYEERPPMIALTGLEETYMQSIAAGHDAADCLGKPVSIDKLKSALEKSMSRMKTSDRWGHMRSPPSKKDGEPKFRGIAAKMSATSTMKGEDSNPPKRESQGKGSISTRPQERQKSRRSRTRS
jgi:DNA-binding NtrC family response regulator